MYTRDATHGAPRAGARWDDATIGLSFRRRNADEVARGFGGPSAGGSREPLPLLPLANSKGNL